MHKQFKFWLGVCLALVLSAASLESEAQAGRRNRIMQSWERQHANQSSWSGAYGHQTTGTPIALIVPPTARTMRVFNWGVSRNTISPIYHQYSLNRTTGNSGGRPFLRTPMYPSSTSQFGVYYIRGPW